MRCFVLVLLLALINPALAQYWQSYANAAYGYAIDIPPGYEHFADSADGNGAIFMLDGRFQELTVWGARLGASPEAFGTAVTARQGEDEAAGWNVSYQALTPDWATWSARRDDFVLYQRMILLCDRQSYAAVRSVYPMQDLYDMHGVIEGIVRSFQASAC